MYAVVISEPGGPEVLKWQEGPDVTPGPDEIVIDVAAAGVNRADVVQRQGFYPPPPGASPYPGLECSGRVIELGANVTDWQLGDEVCALLPGGGYAEQVAIDQSLVLPVPAGVSLVDAAGLVEVAATVYSNLAGFAGLASGETLLVHGGSGGIGTFAIQWATRLGATVLTTARRGNAEALRALGARLVIDYRDEDFVEQVAAHTDGAGADVILDHIGAAYLERNISVLASDGRLAIIGMQGGRKAELNLSALMAKRGRLMAAGLRSRPLAQRAAILQDVRRHIWPEIAAGAIAPMVAARLPMTEAVAAHELMAGGGYVGKILLTSPSD